MTTEAYIRGSTPVYNSKPGFNAAIRTKILLFPLVCRQVHFIKTA